MNNTINLPEEFKNRMKEYLGDDYNSFIDSYNMPEVKSIHVNTNKMSLEEFEKIEDFTDSKIPDIFNGYYYSQGSIGQNPFHHAGIIYSQDPAAQLPVTVLKNILTGNEKVLDLCAAPGGKTSQLAQLLNGPYGALVSNEPNPTRNKILTSNIERMGYTNILVTKLLPDELETYYTEYFDVILVDAPCSGEGMFRKYPDSVNEWSLENVMLCSNRQKEILTSAINMLKPGGHLLYSTCTYAREEDEEITLWLNNQGLTNALTDNPNGIKCYPHKHKGEGQYYNLFRKSGQSNILLNDTVISSFNKLSKNAKKQVVDQLGQHFNDTSIDFYEINDRVVIFPKSYIKMPRHGITLAGVIAGEFSKGRFIPHHHIFHTYGNLFDNQVELSSNLDLVTKYLHGEEIYVENTPDGYGVINFYGNSLGGFKASKGRLKNHYPKGLRNM